MSEAAKLLNSKAGFKASMRSSIKDQFAIPLHRPENRKQWAYLDSASRVRRHVWAIDIKLNRVHCCFLDYEMRRKGEKAAALVRPLSGANISNADFIMILHGISSSEGDWSNHFFSQHSLITTKCSHTWSTAEQCANTINRLLRGLM